MKNSQKYYFVFGLLILFTLVLSACGGAANTTARITSYNVCYTKLLRFVDAIQNAERIELHSFEKEMETGVKAGFHTFFEGCLPVEIIASRGQDSLAYGPMRPVVV